MAYLFGSAIIRFTTGTKDAEIIKNAVFSLRMHLPFYPVLGILLCLRTMMQAVNMKIAPVMSSTMELLVKVEAAIWLISVWGFLATCITEPVTWVICAVFLSIVYVANRRRIYGTQERSFANGY